MIKFVTCAGLIGIMAIVGINGGASIEGDEPATSGRDSFNPVQAPRESPSIDLFPSAPPHVLPQSAPAFKGFDSQTTAPSNPPIFNAGYSSGQYVQGGTFTSPLEALRMEYADLAREHAELLNVDGLKQEVERTQQLISELKAKQKVAAAEEILRSVLEQYPESVAAEEARRMLGKPESELDTKPRLDSPTFE